MNNKKSMRVSDYIGHIVDAIAHIEKYVKGMDQSSFIENDLVQDAVIRNIEIIGEAANNIKEADGTFWQAHPELRLEEAYKMRNALAHGYSTVNLNTVWQTIQNDLPVLKTQIGFANLVFGSASIMNET